MNREQSVLISKIQKAFSTRRYPGDDNLVNGDSPEYLDVAKRFRGIDWTEWEDRSNDLLINTRGDISFFSPTAYCYYLPLYLLQILKHPTGYPFSGEVITSLSPSSTSLSHGLVSSRLALMEKPQLTALLSFLRFVEKRDGKNLKTYPLADAINSVSKALESKA